MVIVRDERAQKKTIGGADGYPSLFRSSPSNLRILILLVLILLAAAAFRFIGLDNFPTPTGATPPGLEHDEVAHWLINQDILAGNHAVYFTEAYGHEALYHYLQAGFGALVGDHALALRLPSAYFGILLVAVTYVLGQRLFGPRVGLWSAAFLAVLFWPVFYSRLALRAISLPVLSGLAAYFWWRAIQDWSHNGRAGQRWRGSENPRASDLSFAMAGLFAGLSLHTYMAARAVPIFFGLFTIYLLLFHRSIILRYKRGLAIFWLIFVLVASPLALYLLANPGAEVRITEIDAPLKALRAGDFRPIVENSIKIAGMFGIHGDPLWRQNIAGRPVFNPILATLFYAGVALSLWRWREPRYAFQLLWLATAVIPSLVTVDAPSSIRIINLLPVLMLFPMTFIHRPPYLSTVREKLSTELVTKIVNLGLMSLLAFTALHTIVGLWRIWPANDEVRFVWQAALTEAAAYLDRSSESGPVAVGGWTPETMDPPTMALTLRRGDLSLRYFDPTQSLILPDSIDERAIRIVVPSILPFADHLQRLIGSDEQVQGEFTLYSISGNSAISPSHPAHVNFGSQVVFIGHDIVEGCVVGEACTLATYWEVTALPAGPRRLFLHAVNSRGETVAQDDRLGAPAEHWQTGDIIVQLLTLTETTGELRLGIYNPQDGQRLTTESGADHVKLVE